ncbi:unnamed protein product [Commensalibacter communis]|nr:unnamed protein product [Commensalibacter communis]
MKYEWEYLGLYFYNIPPYLRPMLALPQEKKINLDFPILQDGHVNFDENFLKKLGILFS